MLKEEVIKNMEKIVSECMGEENPACVTNCPMHTNVKEYIRLLREGKGEEALLTIREKLFLPGTLGRICAHPCEGKCKINEISSPMSIAGLKRYIADNFDKEELWSLEKEEKNGKKVAVIGAGPSGLQSALDLIRKGYEVVVFEKLPVKGGMMAVGIPEYRLPRDILAHEISYLEKLGVEFKMNCEIGKHIPMKDIVDNFDAVIVAVGKHKGRVGTDIVSNSIYSAGDFLRIASLEKEKLSLGERVLVVGGGDVAMDCARTSRRIKGVKEVFSVCLENSFDEMTASKHEVKGAYDEGINFCHGRGIKEIVMSEDNKIQEVKLKKCLSLFDENKNFSPVFDENQITDLKVDTIIFAIGQAVDGDFAKGYLSQRRNSTFECDPATLQSKDNKKIFITGDASGESVIVIQAMGTGRRVAESVDRYLQNKDLLEGRNIEDTKSYDTKLVREVNWEDIKERRLEINEVDPKERIKSFVEVSLGYTKEQAQYEADRCRQCECRLCMKECMMLKNFTSCPKELFRNYLEKGYQEMDKMIAFSCNECSQCTIKCPKDLDLKSNFIEMRKEYIKDNGNKQVIESFVDADRIQRMECSKEYCTTLIPEKKPKYVFVPGCTIPAYKPELVEKVYAHLKKVLSDDVTAMLRCCGKVTKMIGQSDDFILRNRIALDEIEKTGADTIITICPSCFVTFEQTATDKKVISYWDLMREKIGFPEELIGKGKDSDVVFNIHDSCVTRNVSSHHENVRWILDKLGYKYEEMNNVKENTRCCGVGGMVCNSNPELYKEIYTRRANDCTQDSVISYCGSCRGTLEAAGKDSLHILDLMFGDTYTESTFEKRSYSSEEDMWKNRLKTKEMFLNKK